MAKLGTMSPSLGRSLEAAQTAQMVVCVGVDSVFTPDECGRIVRLRDTLGWDAAPIPEAEPGRGPKRSHVVDTSVRRTERTHILATPDTQWIYDRLSGAVNTANDQAWRFRIAYMEPLQLLRYTEGGYFDWHSDLGSRGIASLRKVSSTIILSHPDDFDGGEMQFLTGGKELTPTSAQGKAFMFPSYINHRVKPVTRGVRHVLILWTVGKRSMR
jgi:PKHD-type hydroxylase